MHLPLTWMQAPVTGIHAQAYHVKVSGSYAYVGDANAHGLAIFDMSTPASPSWVGSVHSTTGMYFVRDRPKRHKPLSLVSAYLRAATYYPFVCSPRVTVITALTLLARDAP